MTIRTWTIAGGVAGAPLGPIARGSGSGSHRGRGGARAAVLGAVLVMGLGGCGGGSTGSTGSTAGPSASSAAGDSAKWAACLREKGFTAKSDGTFTAADGQADSDAVAKAQTDCLQFAPDRSFTPEQEKEASEAILIYNKCLRAAGYEPPAPNSAGGENSAGFRAAEKKCRDQMPDLKLTDSAGSGS